MSEKKQGVGFQKGKIKIKKKKVKLKKNRIVMY